MNCEMSYLLGMICGNGEISRDNHRTTVSIQIPHKKLETDDFYDIKLYVKASITDIRSILEPLIGSDLNFNQEEHITRLFFSKENTDYLIREIIRLINASSSRYTMRVPKEIFSAKYDEKKYFLKGFADVTGYVRRSNHAYGIKHNHRVYIEIPHNWDMVIDIANLLKDVDIPIQNINWAHPNMRDGKLKKYNMGNVDFWKKEHQIKIWVNEFEKIGFGILHKNEALKTLSKELVVGYKKEGKDPYKYTHRYYWETRTSNRPKPLHPGVNDPYIPMKIKETNFDSWKDIARELGYHE